MDSFDEYTTSSGEVFRLTSSLGDILAPERYFRAKAKAKRLEHGFEFLLLDCLAEYLEPEPVRPSPLGLWLMPDEAWLLVADALSPLISAELYNALLGLGDGLPLDDE